uniref:Transmembrane protein 230a n=1 Tax=Cyprinus carpio TaxID=7962 RepID=A0A8C1T2F1_CYPCA
MMASRNNTASAAPNNKVKYSRLADSDEGYIDLQFKKTPPKVPYKAIALATFLFLVGSILIVVGSLLLAGYINVVVSKHNCSIINICRYVRLMYGLVVVPRSHDSSSHHRHPDLPSRILSSADCLLCFQGLPWLFLRGHPRL